MAAYIPFLVIWSFFNIGIVFMLNLQLSKNLPPEVICIVTMPLLQKHRQTTTTTTKTHTHINVSEWKKNERNKEENLKGPSIIGQ